MQCAPGVKSPHEYLYYAGNTPKITGARNARFKLLTGNNDGLYDLRSDIGETKDVSADYPEVVEMLTREIKRFQEDLDTHSLDAPIDEGNAAYKAAQEKEKGAKKKAKKKK